MDKHNSSTQGFQLTSNGIAIPFHPRTLDSDIIQTVDGRDIHRTLGIGEDYSHWIKRQIARAYLVENRDVWVFAENSENSGRGRPAIEYYFSVDSAKHIAMLSSTEMGHRIREYFIAAEKELRRIDRESLLKQTFLLPLYDRESGPLYPPVLFEQICRVYGFPSPKGSQHSPGCRGVVHRYINGILPAPIQDVLFDRVENPYLPDGKTRQERHWRRIIEEQRRNVISPRIDTVIETCLRCDNKNREKFKRDLMIHDRNRGIVIRLSPKVSLRLATNDDEQLWLFSEAIA